MDSIWFNKLTAMERSFIPFRYDPAFQDGLRMSSIENRNWLGESLPREAFPNALVQRFEEDPEYRAELAPIYQSLPDLFGAHVFMASKRAVDILSQFDMGDGHFYEMPLFSTEGTRLPGEFYAWNFGNTKETLLPEFSEQLEVLNFKVGTHYSLPLEGMNGKVAVTAAALNGPAVWIDPRVIKALFFRGDVAEALRQAGLASDLQLRKCVIVS